MALHIICAICVSTFVCLPRLSPVITVLAPSILITFASNLERLTPIISKGHKFCFDKSNHYCAHVQTFGFCKSRLLFTIAYSFSPNKRSILSIPSLSLRENGGHLSTCTTIHPAFEQNMLIENQQFTSDY